MKLNLIKKLQEDFKTPVIELYGNKRIVVFDCKGVNDYSSNAISLDLGDCVIKIRGEGLNAAVFNFGQTDITGLIYGVEFM